MVRRLALGAASLALIGVIVACQPVDGGAGGSQAPETPQGSTAESGGASPAETNVAPAAPTDAPEETPIASMGGDYDY